MKDFPDTILTPARQIDEPINDDERMTITDVVILICAAGTCVAFLLSVYVLFHHWITR